MGSKATTTNFLFFPSFDFFFLFTAHSICGKKPKTIEISGQSIKFDFFPVPKSNTEMGSLSAKKRDRKILMLGHL